MDHFWGNVFEYFRERERAALFYGLLLVSGGLGFAGFLLCQIPYTRPAAGLLLLGWLGRALLRARARRPARYKSSPLSRDELNKARSKLMKAKS
jgi:hypothetical protein